ncbi:hypothetical protein GYMLUDRAFT_193672 [Collybiopsis luxurians FD-317 M1]|nr:hypothetical protein GYMLUDRAFT_193672 [Collybiopsis luxurians FD-317 M1]
MALRFFSFLALFVAAQSQSVPPLQWLNITNLLQGSAKPIPLKDAVIGFDSTSSTVIVFGGESSSGLAQSQTYLLNTQSLTWSSPNPPAGASTSPPARSASVSGNDIAASNRQGFIVIGGKDINNKPLSDIWEFDYGQQFWTQVSISPSNVGPSPRWGAAGGKDPRISAVADLVIPGPNNTFYYTGGFDGSSLEPLSDVWRLNISGVLSSNNLHNVNGSWQEISIHNVDSSSTQGLSSTMVMDSVAIYGGCNITSTTNESCATQNAYVLNTDNQNSISPNPCPAPRLGAAMTQNLNSVSATTTQAMLLLGTFNSSLWSDANGLEKGEVAFWDLDAGTWIRTIPSGDPGSSGSNTTFPSPREGSAIFSSATPVFGSSSGNYSETLVFGGRDASGNYLNELWVLRAYNGATSPSQPKWSGFGDGVLKTGVNADGTGVQVQFISTCASFTATPGSSPSSSNNPGSPTSSTNPSSGSGRISTIAYDTSTSHKVLAPLSLALLLTAIVLGRVFSPFFNDKAPTVRSAALSALILLGWFASGIAGLILAFTSISSTTSTLNKRSSSSLHLQTNHGKAALALFIALYGVVPLLWLFPNFRPRTAMARSVISEQAPSDKQQTTSVDTAEKLRTVQSRSRTPSRPSSPRQRTHSWGPSILWRPSTDRRLSSDADSNTSSAHQSASVEPPRSFEVLNRPPRIRRIHTANMERTPAGPLRNIDWLQRRRSLNTFGDLDYALTQAQRAHEREQNSTPATTDRLNATVTLVQLSPRMPGTMRAVSHILLQLSILSLTIISLIVLWPHSLAGFVVFLIWTIAYYVALIILAWKGIPNVSILAVVLTRLRTNPDHPQPQELAEYIASQSPPVSAPDHYVFPTQGPYYHEPLFQTAGSTDLSHGGPRSVATDGDGDDDEDEDARQRRIESEMERREIVTVTTVPRRKLLVANPS